MAGDDCTMASDDALTGAAPVRLFALAGADEDVLTALEERLGGRARHGAPVVESDEVALLLDADGLSLVGDGEVLRADFTKMLPRIAHNKLHRELVVRAAKIKGADEPLSAVDATAGLGEDAFLLAAASFEVTLYERDPVIAALLDDALRRGAADPDLAPIVSRMELVEGDSVAALPAINPAPDVVLLDPMFPERRKSALVKKKFQILHRLERPCSDEAALLNAALAARPRKVVIKRPLKGPYLADRKPEYSLKGTSIRYDCIALARE